MESPENFVFENIGGYSTGGLIAAALRAAGVKATCSLRHYTSTETNIVIYSSDRRAAWCALRDAVKEAERTMAQLCLDLVGTDIDTDNGVLCMDCPARGEPPAKQ